MRVTKVYWENLKAYEEGCRNIVNVGSSRSGKTYGIVQVNDRIAVKSPIRRKISIVSQSYNHLEQGVLEEYAKYQYNEGLVRQKAKNHYKINKSIINYFSLGDEPGRAVGPGRNILYLNEPNRGISYESYFQLRKRTNECIFIDYNPSGKFWLHKQGILEEKGTRVIHSSWLDNLANLTKFDIEDFIDMKRRSKLSDIGYYHWKVYGEGVDAVLMEERIMPLLYKATKVPDDAIEIPSYLDFGWHPDPTSFGRLWIRKGPTGEELYIQPLVYDTRLHINSKAEGAVNLTEILRSKGINPAHLIVAESADPRAITDMRDDGFNIVGVKKTSVETSLRQFHKYKIFFVDGGDKYAYEQSFEEFDNYKFDRDKQTNEIIPTPEDGQADHTIDAVRYVLLSRNFWWSV